MTDVAEPPDDLEREREAERAAHDGRDGIDDMTDADLGDHVDELPDEGDSGKGIEQDREEV